MKFFWFQSDKKLDWIAKSLTDVERSK